MSRLRSRVTATVAVLAALASGVGTGQLSGAQLSTAAFTASSSSTARVVAAADWTPPQVAVRAPAEFVRGVVPVLVDAHDEESGIRQVTLEVLGAGAQEWTTVCADSSAPSSVPWSCSWDTTALGDGAWTLRATAVDGSGLRTASELVATRVANRLAVVLTSPGEAVRGQVPLRTTVLNAGAATHTVRVEYSVSGSGTWRTLCGNLSAPYACTWSTTAFAAGEYDLRAVLVLGGTTTHSEVVEGVEVDNVAPSVVLDDPAKGGALRGAVTFTASASDAHSGVDQVVLQRSTAGAASWHELCTVSDEPWSCRFDTTRLADGPWDFRAVATDAAGNATTSAVVGPRTVDNTVASVTVVAPATAGGTATLEAVASSPAGVARVVLQVAASGSGAFSDVCTDTAAPWSCRWDTTTVADGTYDLRAVMTDREGQVTVSAPGTVTTVDNSPLRGVDVQAVNGGGRPGRADSGDRIHFTFSTEVATSTVLPGWTGAPRAVVVRLRDGRLLGRNPKQDGLDVVVASGNGASANLGAVDLGAVNLRRDHVRSGSTVLVNATMSAATVTVSGTVRSTVTLVLGSVTSGGNRLRTANGTGAMVWTPSGAVRDLLGSACATASVVESGPADREF